MKFMTGAVRVIDGAELLRHALGLHRRGRLRDLDAGRRGRGASRAAAGAARGQADRPRRARFAAARGRALPLRPRHRHHDHADRGGACCGASARSAARRAASPAPRVIQKQIAEGAPRKRVGLLPEGKAHRRARARRSPIAAAGDRQGHVGRLRAHARPRRSPWATSSAAHAANGTKVELMVRGKPRAGRDRAHALRHARYYRG